MNLGLDGSSRPPWCLLNQEERKELLENMKPALEYWYKTWWKPFAVNKYQSATELYEAYFSGERDPGP